MKEIFLICGAIVSIFATITFVVGGGYLVFTMIKDDIEARRQAEEELEFERAKSDYLKERHDENY